MSHELNAPTGACALDDARTQQALQQMPQIFWRRFAKKGFWLPVGLLLLLCAWLFNIGWLVLIGAFPALVGCFAVGELMDSFRWLARIKRVLSVYPWEPQPRVKPNPHVVTRRKASRAVRLGLENGKWSVELLARNVMSQSRWDSEMEKGVWFAGDLPFGGVIARPGCEEIAFVQARVTKELASEREAASPERHERAYWARLEEVEL